MLSHSGTFKYIRTMYTNAFGSMQERERVVSSTNREAGECLSLLKYTPFHPFKTYSLILLCKTGSYFSHGAQGTPFC